MNLDKTVFQGQVITVILVLMCALHGVTGWGLFLAIPEWFYNIFATILIPLSFFSYRVTRANVATLAELYKTDPSNIQVANLARAMEIRDQGITPRIFFAWLCTASLVFYFFIHGLYYTTAVLVLSTITTFVVGKLMANLIKREIIPQ